MFFLRYILLYVFLFVSMQSSAIAISNKNKLSGNIEYIARVNNNYITQHSIEQYKKLYQILKGIQISDNKALKDLIRQYVYFDNASKVGINLTKSQVDMAIDIFARANNQEKDTLLEVMQGKKIQEVFVDFVKFRSLSEILESQFLSIDDSDKKLFDIGVKGDLFNSSPLYLVSNDLNDLYYDDFIELAVSSKKRQSINNILALWYNNSYILIINTDKKDVLCFND